MSFRQWLKHAFAVDEQSAVEPTEQQRVPVDWLSRQIAKRHLTTPALIAMEMCRPLNWLGAQGMHLTEPAVWAVAPKPFYEGYKSFASLLEHRGSIEYICSRLEQMEQEYVRKEQAGRAGTDGSADAAQPNDDEH